MSVDVRTDGEEGQMDTKVEADRDNWKVDRLMYTSLRSPVLRLSGGLTFRIRCSISIRRPAASTYEQAFMSAHRALVSKVYLWRDGTATS